MENRETFTVELTRVELVAIINGLYDSIFVNDDESFKPLINELKNILYQV